MIQSGLSFVCLIFGMSLILTSCAPQNPSISADAAGPKIVARYDDAQDYLPTANRLNTTGARLYLPQMPGELTVNVMTSRNIEVRIFENIPKGAKAGLLLFAGGSGVLSVDAQGNLGLSFNTLSRSRDLFNKNLIATFVVDATSDRLGKAGLEGFRSTKDYENDLAAVVRAIRANFDKPLFAVGHSMGTISAANIATDPSNGVAGIALLSPVTTGDHVDKITDVSLASVAVPVLLVTNVQDGCAVSPPNQSARLSKMFGTADVTIKEISGGLSPASGPCGTFGYHGFFGTEQQLVDIVDAWIAAHS